MIPALPIVALMFSGGASLLLEVIWSRVGVFIFGSTTLSVTVVFALFMGGLAAGNWLAARRLPDIRRPFLAYAAVETATALAAFSFSATYRFASFPGGLYAGVFVVLFLLATTLMGLTVPLIVSGLKSASPEDGRGLALAYGANTVGAALGALSAAFLWIPSFGLARSSQIASGLLLAAAVLGFLSQKRLGAGSVPTRADAVPGLTRGTAALAVWCGAASLAVEIVWTRLLSLILGPSVYALGSILFVYLLGMGLGAWFAPAVLKRVRPRPLVALSLLGLALAGAFSVLWLGLLPYLFVALVKWMQPSVGALRFIEIALSMSTLFPTAVLHGFVLPVLLDFSGGDRGAASAGRLLAVNTAGSIAGSVLAGLVLIPRVGLLPVLLGILVLHGLIGARIAVKDPRLSPVQRGVLAGSVLLLLGALVFGIVRSWDRAVLSAGVYKYAVGGSLAGGEGKIEVGKLLYYREGAVSTVAVTETLNDVVLSIDGKADASARGDRSTQVLLAALPLSLSERAERALVIGYASGVTAGAASLFASTRVTAVEIEPAVYEAAGRFFGEVNHGPLGPPRHRALVEDGRHFLLGEGEPFDVITSEPSNPWMSGVAPLFTREFFELSRRRLREGGIMCQWLPIYGMSEDLVRSVFRTFSDVFPNVLVFASTEGNDLLLLGSLGPAGLDPRRAEARWTDPALRDELAAIGIRSGADLVGRFLMGTGGARAFGRGGKVNTDDNGFLEYGAPKSLHLKTAEANDRALSSYPDPIRGYLAPGARVPEVESALRDAFEARGRQGLAEGLR